MLAIKVVLVLLFILYVLYKYVTRNYNYWQKKGIPYIKPILIFGNVYKLFTSQQTMGDILATFYKQCKGAYFGIYVLDKPFLFIKDPSLIKRILVKDFQYFCDRNIISNEKCDALASNMLFVSKSPEWKYIRTKMTPTFTSGKMKNMFYMIQESGTDLKSYLDKHFTENEIEVKEVCGKYSTDVITSCAFGLRAHSFKSENSPFRRISREMFESGWKLGFQQMCYFMAHDIIKLFKLPFFDREQANFLRTVFWKTIEERERTKEIRHDVIDVVKDFKNKPDFSDNFRFEGDRVLAQAVQFFTAGFETVSTTMSFALYELCLHPQIQERVRCEIKETLLEHNEINYAAVQSMTYLSMVVKETLRKYPALPFLERQCMNDYKLPGEDFVIEKGIPVYISLLGLHHDPQHFPNPEVFNPERFSQANEVNCFNYLPFGDGPRNCIGERFGLLATKTGLIQILSEFEVEASAGTPTKIKFSPKTFFLSSSVGLPMKFKKNSLFD